MTDLEHLFSRRQFVERGTLTVGALVFAGLLPARVLAAEAPSELAGSELEVLAALAASILGAVSKPLSEASALGLQSPEALAQQFASMDPESRAYVAGVLDAIDRAPSSGSFTSLSDAARQEFLRTALAPLGPPPPTAAQLAELAVVAQQIDADYAEFVAELDSGIGLDVSVPPSPEAPDPPPASPELFSAPAPAPPDVVLGNVVLAGLELVATPPAPPPPALPPPPPLSPALLASLVDLVLQGVPGGKVPQSLIDQVIAELDVPEPELELPPPPRPAAVLGDALAVFVLGT